jgi:hypothetical protein
MSVGTLFLKEVVLHLFSAGGRIIYEATPWIDPRRMTFLILVFDEVDKNIIHSGQPTAPRFLIIRLQHDRLNRLFV